MRLVLAAICIAAFASMARAQTQPNFDQLSAAQPINGGLPRLTITRGSLSRRARQVRSPQVAAALRQPILKVALRQTCRLLPIAHQRPVLIRSNARFPLGIASRAVTDSSMRRRRSNGNATGSAWRHMPGGWGGNGAST